MVMKTTFMELVDLMWNVALKQENTLNRPDLKL